MGNPDSESLSQNNQKDENINRRKSAMPREKLISTAVAFLLDKKILSQEPKLLKTFLMKKGLTEEEVSIAFQHVEASRNQSIVAEYAQTPSHLPNFISPNVPSPPVPSLWHTVHSIVTTVTSIGGILFALYWLWKTYISPYLFGRKPKKKPVEKSLAELEAAVDVCVTDVKTIRSSLETQAEQRAMELTNGVLVTRIQEVKSEINSLKALLLSRNQFPATPAPLGPVAMSIPAWQLSADETIHPEQEGEGEAEEEGSGSHGTTNGSDSSLEIVKDVNN